MNILKLPAKLNTLYTNISWRSFLAINCIFVVLTLAFVISLGRYWYNTLQPRLYSMAETQASILAQSQATLLQEIVQHTEANSLPLELYNAVQTILLVEDPAINESFVRGLSLEFDYDSMAVKQDSLNFVEGKTNCESCFAANFPLLDQNGALVGIAHFNLSDSYFRALSRDMQSKLITESSIALLLLFTVWIVMLVMFHRLNTAKRIIEDSDRAKTRFMANVTHELRTPLNAILGYTQLYKSDPDLAAQYRAGIETIDRSAEHLLLMINDILDFSRADEENLTLNPTDVSLALFLQTLAEMGQISAQLQQIEFCTDFPATLPSEVNIDEKRLRQVLLNLINNAIKFTPEGEVCFQVQTLSQSQRHIQLRFSVKDTGLGIAAEDLQRIFIPFVQIENAITRAEGSGLGLAISQRILHLMNSRLRVKSQPGSGSVFYFDLNLRLAANGKQVDIVTPIPPEPQTLILPSPTTLEALIAHAQKHNILGLRNCLRDLQDDPQYADFLHTVSPYVQSYRFKPLKEKLVAYLKSASAE
ncbi:HAMP domain-containing sensor histidine kinase [Gilvimarinus sp. DA14]|uniref:sensor histidine kinase n=1 Tax=Gilvimarinus sp. DA14 TaxID=2956798 RepID=UPI0020B69DEB|nr:HAMP domain-containing sensor histidine kinase [Gilvimarinus sp. DA14]UTF61773.1 HAMP domain-containing histidine kinase [Gilvimarinus sp. DA14]